MSYSLVDNELDDNDDDTSSPHREKRNAVKGNLNIVNKFARHEEVRSGGSRRHQGRVAQSKFFHFQFFQFCKIIGWCTPLGYCVPLEILDPPLVLTN